MSNDLLNAKKQFESGGFSCVLLKGNLCFTTHDRGVLPLMNWLDRDNNFCGFCAADKIVGRAAAFLYILMGVKEVYSPVMSEGAVSLLNENGIKAFCDTRAKAIINRPGTDICPMEKAVESITDPQKAYEAIKSQLNKL